MERLPFQDARDSDNGRLHYLHTTFVRRGYAPRHMAFHTSLPVCYLLTEAVSSITALRYNPVNEELAPFEVVSEFYVGRFNKGAEIAVHPNDKFLYASNRGSNTLVRFMISEDGWLHSPKWYDSYGDIPRHFTFDLSGKYLFAANERSDSIISFVVDDETGELTQTGQMIHVPSPTCIVLSGVVNDIEPGDISLLHPVQSDYKVSGPKL